MMNEIQSHKERFLTEVSKHYLGPSHVPELILTALFARGHVLVEGVPGIAKTTLVKTVAETLGCSYSRIQFTPDLMPQDVTGTLIPNLINQDFRLHKGPIFSQVILADEVNRAPAKTQSALLEAMQEGQVSIEGESHPLPEPFMVLATQNPVEQRGVYALPEAQLDRFLFRLQLGYPSWDEEKSMLQTWNRKPPEVEPIWNAKEIQGFRSLVDEVHVTEELMDWMIALMRATRENPWLRLGGSPRASLSLLRASKAYALLQGREAVLPDDVYMLLPYLLNHRLILTPEGEFEGVLVDNLLENLLKTLPFSSLRFP